VESALLVGDICVNLRVRKVLAKTDNHLERSVILLFLWIAVARVTLMANPQTATTQGQKSSGGGAKPVKIAGPYLSREDMDEYTKVVLKNGLTVILFERRDMPLVSIVTYVKTGYLNEPDENRGISHVLEHMFFKGTSKRDVSQIAKETKRLGGYLNAGTFYDYTYYYTVLPSENFKPGLEIQADALRDPALLEGELQREILVILQEARRKLDSPGAFSLEKLYGLAFEVSPLGRWRIGDESTLLSLGRKQVLDFYRKWYVPSNIVLVIAGNLDRRAVLDEVVKRYGNMPSGVRVNLTLAAEPLQTGLRYRELRGDISESFVQIGFAVPAAFTRDWYICKVLEAVLTVGRSAILNRTLKEGLGLVSSVSSSFLDLKNQGYLAFTLTVDPSKIDRAEASAFAELDRMRSGFLGEEDVERAKMLLERDFYLDQEKLDELALQLAHTETLARYSEWRNYVKRIRAVDSQQVIQAARQYLSMAQCSILEYQPGTASPRSFSPQTFVDYLARLLPRAMEEVQQTQGLEGILGERKKQAVATPSHPREKAPAEISPAAVDYALTEYSILRGPNVLVKESHALPLISVGLFFPGGRVFESPENNGITELMVRTSIKGSHRLNALRVVSMLENYGVRMDLKTEPDFFGYILTGLSQNIADAFETLWDVIRNPQFAEAEIKREKDLLQADVAKVRDSNVLYPQQLFLQALYGDHAYGLPPYGSKETVSGLTEADIIRWHERFVKRAVPLIVIAGDTEGSAFAARFANQLSTSDASFVDLKKALPVRRLEAPSVKVEIRDRKQTALVIGFLGPPAESPSSDSLVVIQNLVSGLGGRFFEELREKQSLAYTVSATHTRRVLDGSFSCYVATSPENEQRALDSLKQEFRRLIVTPASDEELVRARNYSVGIYRMHLQQRAEQVIEFAQSLIFGKSVDEIKRHPHDLLEVDQNLIKETAAKYFDVDRLSLGIVRALAK
jgi:zinc protease